MFLSGAPVGINLEGVDDWSRSFMFVDAMKSARQFGSVASPWDQSAPVDANGWPTGDAGACIITVGDNTTPGEAVVDISGTYKFSATGDVTVTPVLSAATVQNRVYDPDTNTTTADVVVQTGATQLYLDFTGAAGGAKNIKLIRPGYAPDTSQIFTNQFLTAIAPFQTLRLMDYLQTNNNPVVNWSDRSHVTDAEQTSTKGAAWEYAIDLANETHKDLWINIPEGATDDYVTQLATLFKNTLDPSLHVYVEYSNEVWNSSFLQNSQNQANAMVVEAQDPSNLNYDNSDNIYYWGWRQVANRLVQIRDDFASVYGESAINTTVRPVLASQIGWSYVLQNQLEYLENRFGADLSGEIYGVAGAPYMSIGDLTYSATLTPDQVLAALRQNLAQIQTGIEKYRALAGYYNVKDLYYEGGVDLTENAWGNISAKIDANYAAGMESLISDYLENATQDGVDQVMFFDLASAYGASGTYGLTESIANLSGSKYQGVLDALNDNMPAITGGFALPTGTGTTTLDSGDFLLDQYGNSGNGGGIPGVWSGQYYTYLLNVQSSGDYALRVSGANGAGTLQLILDGNVIGNVDVDAPGATPVSEPAIDLAQNLSDTSLSAGLHTLRIRILSGHFDMGGLMFLGGDDALPAQDVTGLIASPVDSSSVKLSWLDSAGEAGFVIERSTTGIGGWRRIGSVAQGVLSYIDTGLALGTTYYYRVTATGLGGDSDESDPAAATTLFLATPTAVAANETGTDSVRIQWSNVHADGGYLLERSPNGQDGWTTVTTTSTLSYLDTNLSAGTKYYYRVTALGSLGNSAISAVAGTMTDNIPAPAGLAVTAVDGTSLKLTWNDVIGETGFVVERSLDGKDGWQQDAAIDAGVTTYLDTGLAGATVYYYRVKAEAPGGESDYSNVAGMTTQVVASGNPTVPTAEDGDHGSTGGGNIVVAPPVVTMPIVTTPVVTTPVTTPITGPVVETGGDKTVTDSTLPVAPVSSTPAQPAGPAGATAALSSVRVAWNAVAGAVSYLIERSSADGNWTQVAHTADLHLTDAQVSSNTAYTYRITAVFADGSASAAATVSTRTAQRMGAFWWW
ncbi:MAG TPA: fibronectin type III domain-containing protein [Phycisphaerae bacterium]|nr:fibronectin type III domain-containing protein [Phycisphaerae bacterium]